MKEFYEIASKLSGMRGGAVSCFVFRVSCFVFRVACGVWRVACGVKNTLLQLVSKPVAARYAGCRRRCEDAADGPVRFWNHFL